MNKAAAARAALPKDTSPHILRHSAAVHMVESGISFAETAQFLGHASEAMTFRVYGRFSRLSYAAPLRRLKANVRVAGSSPAAPTIPKNLARDIIGEGETGRLP
jgi:integrase